MKTAKDRWFKFMAFALNGCLTAILACHMCGIDIPGMLDFVFAMLYGAGGLVNLAETMED
jgi:hypothetical protein